MNPPSAFEYAGSQVPATGRTVVSVEPPGVERCPSTAGPGRACRCVGASVGGSVGLRRRRRRRPRRSPVRERRSAHVGLAALGPGRCEPAPLWGAGRATPRSAQGWQLRVPDALRSIRVTLLSSRVLYWSFAGLLLVFYWSFTGQFRGLFGRCGLVLVFSGLSGQPPLRVPHRYESSDFPRT